MKVQQRRRLTDLYSRGEYIELNDGDDPLPIVLWLRKMTPVEAETAYLKASARRATLLAGSKTDPPSDLYVSLRGEIENFQKADLVAWAVGSDMVSRRPVIESKIASAEEWTENRYLESLHERFAEDDFQAKETDDPEMMQILSELGRYESEVEAAVQTERERLTELYNQDSEAELQERILKDMVQGQGDSLWLQEFQACQIWLCTYEGDDKTKRYFASRAEVDELQAETARQIREAIERLHVGDLEGKDSQQTVDSSVQSASPEVLVPDSSSSLPA